MSALLRFSHGTARTSLSQGTGDPTTTTAAAAPAAAVVSEQQASFVLVLRATNNVFPSIHHIFATQHDVFMQHILAHSAHTIA